MGILYLIAAMIALVWGVVLLRRAGLLGPCIAIIPLAACFGFDFFHFDAGPISLTCDRLLLAGLCVVYVVYRGLGWTESPRIDRIDMLFGAFLFLLSANTVLHDWQFNQARPLVNLVLLFLMPAALFWIAREAKFDHRHLQWMYGFLGAFSLYLAVTAVAEVKHVPALVFPRYIISSPYLEWVGRGRGPFLNPVTNGIYLTAGLLAIAMFWPRVNRFGKLTVIAAIGVVFLGVYCTLTRSCWLGAAASLGLVALAGIPRYWRPSVLIAGALAASLVLCVKAESFAAFKRDRDVSTYDMAESAKLRPALAAVAWKIAWDNPLFGCGFGLYRKVNVDYLNDPNIEYPLEKLKPYVQHNVVLSLLAETGFIGVALYLALLAGWFHRAWSVWDDEQLPLATRQSGLLLAAFLIQWLIQGMFHDNSLMVNANLLLFFLAGVSQGVYAKSGLKVAAQVRRRDDGSRAASDTQRSPCNPPLPVFNSLQEQQCQT